MRGRCLSGPSLVEAPGHSHVAFAVSLFRVRGLCESRCCFCRDYSSVRWAPPGPKKGIRSVKKTPCWLRGHGAVHRLVGLGNTIERREGLFRTSVSFLLFSG